MANIFNDLQPKQSIENMINSTIQVEGKIYQFSEFIENEIISDFPTYSHRMRDTFVKASKMIDTYLSSISSKLNELEKQLDSKYSNLSVEKQRELTEFINARRDEIAEYIKLRQTEIKSFIDTKNQEFTHHVNAKNEEVTNHIRTKNEEMQQKFTEYNEWYKNKDKIINDNLTEILSKLEQFNHVLDGSKATEDKLGLITIKDIRDNVPLSTKERVLQIMKGESV